jgi:signal transduction histidine kinase/CheY-like chemotaxis protein
MARSTGPRATFRGQFLAKTAAACLIAGAVQAVVVIAWTGSATIPLIALAIGAVIGVAMLFRMRDALLEPSGRVASGIERIVKLGIFRDRVEKPGQAEFDAVADQVNVLLDKIEQHERAVADLKAQHARQADQQVQVSQVEAEDQRRAMKELVLAKAAAEESSLAKSAFLFNMSHELRTPLNAIMGYSELLQEGADDDDAEQRAKDIAKILGAGRHLLTLINAVLDLSKIEAGRVELELETVDVAQLLQDVVSTAESLAAAQRNTLALELAGDLGSMHSDPTKIRQVLLNLLGNASKFTTDGSITLEAVRERELADWIVFRVKDTGIGMSVEEQQGLFREFKQGRAAREQPERGTGLGLAISQALCQLLGGAISVESTPGAGSVFTVRLPAEVRKTAESSPRPVTRVANGHDDASRPAVLVIDHDAGARELVRRVTARLGFRMIEATTASEGYRLAVLHEPVAIVLEVALSGQNGWGLLERLTHLPVVGKVPVVVVSVNDDEARSRSLGAEAHLRKPVPTQQLFGLLKDLAGRRSGAPANAPVPAGPRTAVAAV